MYNVFCDNKILQYTYKVASEYIHDYSINQILIKLQRLMCVEKSMRGNFINNNRKSFIIAVITADSKFTGLFKRKDGRMKRTLRLTTGFCLEKHSIEWPT